MHPCRGGQAHETALAARQLAGRRGSLLAAAGSAAPMPSTEWVEELTVVKLKDELKKRGQPVAGKKADLVARLQEYNLSTR